MEKIYIAKNGAVVTYESSKEVSVELLEQLAESYSTQEDLKHPNIYK